jgi:hypothetical protein
MLYFKIHFISLNFTCFGNTNVNIPKLECRMLGWLYSILQEPNLSGLQTFSLENASFFFLPDLTGIFRSHHQSLSFPKRVLNIAVSSERIPFSCVSFLCQTECWIIRLQPQNTLNHSHWHKTAKTCSHMHQLTSSPVLTSFCPEHQTGCFKCDTLYMTVCHRNMVTAIRCHRETLTFDINYLSRTTFITSFCTIFGFTQIRSFKQYFRSYREAVTLKFSE